MPKRSVLRNSPPGWGKQDALASRQPATKNGGGWSDHDTLCVHGVTSTMHKQCKGACNSGTATATRLAKLPGQARCMRERMCLIQYDGRYWANQHCLMRLTAANASLHGIKHQLKKAARQSTRSTHHRDILSPIELTATGWRQALQLGEAIFVPPWW